MGSRRQAAVVVVMLALVACGDDPSGSGTTVDGPTTTVGAAASSVPASTVGDREQDRERIHQSVTAMLEACGDQNRERLRTGMHERMHDAVDGAMFRFGDPTRFELMDEVMTFDADGATVEARLRIHEMGMASVESMFRWRFEWSGSGWWSTDLPPCLDGGPTPVTSPLAPGSTVRDRDQDRSTTP